MNTSPVKAGPIPLKNQREDDVERLRHQAAERLVHCRPFEAAELAVGRTGEPLFERLARRVDEAAERAEGAVDGVAQLLRVLDHRELDVVDGADRRARNLRRVAEQPDALGERRAAIDLLIDVDVLYRRFEQIAELAAGDVDHAVAGEAR